MKILFAGDSPTVHTGFGIVSKNILNRLHKMGHEIAVLGINHYGEPYDQKVYPYPIYPCDKGGPDQVFAYAKFWGIYEAMQPDLVFFLNDPWIIHRYMEFKPEEIYSHTKFLVYYPTDAGPIKKVWMDTLNSMDAQVCYSYYAEGVAIKSNGGKRPDNLHMVYHGVDSKTFYPINQSVARTYLGLPLDQFIVGMVARNQFRKRFDILMAGFADFAKDKTDAKLYLHTALNDIGYDILDLAVQLDLEDKLILTEGVTPAKGVTDSRLNYIYNSLDVHALISLGDGFGLPVAESMATGCPQLVSDHSCLQELVKDHGGLTAKTAAWISNTSAINTWGGITDPQDIAKKLNILYKNREQRIKLAEQAYNFITQEKFTWDYAANEFNQIIKKLFHIL
jgi:glycosyltransferase involved in cell wall biosynthesis